MDAPVKKKKRINTAAKGARLERLAISMMKEQGYYCIRSAASKGIFDIIAINSQHCVGIQVKANKSPSKEEMNKILACQNNIPINFLRQVWVFHDGSPKNPEIFFV